MNDIIRTPGPFANRSRAVSHRLPGGGGTVWALATARNKSADVAAQTEDLLTVIDGYLAAAGTDRTRLLRAEVFMADLPARRRWTRLGRGGYRRAAARSARRCRRRCRQETSWKSS